MPAERWIGDVPVPSGPAEPVHSPLRAPRRAEFPAFGLGAIGYKEIFDAG
jgi:hypothetical protein